MSLKRGRYNSRTQSNLTTEGLIDALVADLSPIGLPPRLLLVVALIASVVWAGAALTLTIGVRADIAAVVGTAPFLYKFVITITFTATAFALVRNGLHPEPFPIRSLWPLLIGPMLLAGAVLIELLTLESSAWVMAATGKNWLLCMVAIPALGIVPLAIFICVLRRGAPSHPGLAGFCAGASSGGVAATAYAAYCTDDSALFMATCYIPAIALLATLGAVLGSKLARW